MHDQLRFDKAKQWKKTNDIGTIGHPYAEKWTSTEASYLILIVKLPEENVREFFLT